MPRKHDPLIEMSCSVKAFQALVVKPSYLLRMECECHSPFIEDEITERKFVGNPCARLELASIIEKARNLR